MAYSVNSSLRGLGKTVLYVTYNLGLGILVGLARTIVAVYYIAKASFYKNQANQRTEEQGFVGRVKRVAVRHTQDAFKAEWEGQLVRGVAEIVPFLGTAYFTYKDFNKKASPLGIAELREMIQAEYVADGIKHTATNRYNPLDYRLQRWMAS